MKIDSHPPRSDSNTPAEMFARAAYVGFLGACAAGLTLTLLGAALRDGRCLAAGTLALAVAWRVRGWLHRRGQLEPAAEAFDAVGMGEPAAENARIDRLVSLLREWDTLEQKRGRPDFDPWAVQALRHDIQETVDRSPDLARLFHQ
ncbi:MAG TPA: hypothetical protein VHD62_12950 [Opitutaceae bacterium]|nr:hypothetical protein [Opitutaceae bacterium]